MIPRKLIWYRAIALKYNNFTDFFIVQDVFVLATYKILENNNFALHNLLTD